MKISRTVPSRRTATVLLSTLAVLALAGGVLLLNRPAPASQRATHFVSTPSKHRHVFVMRGRLPVRIDAYWNPRHLRSSAAGSNPWIAYVHGGGWAYGAVDESTAVRLCERMVSDGLTCFSLDYPLLPATYSAQQAQVTRELAWIRRHAATFRLDQRLGFVAGHSAGALMAGVAGLGDGRLAGIVSMAGATNVPYLVAHNRDRRVARLAHRLVRDQPLTSRLARSAEVITHVTRSTPRVPYLLVQELGDRAVNVGTSRLLATQLRHRGFPVTLHLFRGNTHQVNVTGPCVPAVDHWLADRIAALRSTGVAG